MAAEAAGLYDFLVVEDRGAPPFGAVERGGLGLGEAFADAEPVLPAGGLPLAGSGAPAGPLPFAGPFPFAEPGSSAGTATPVEPVTPPVP
ncbi:hypothetical protein KMT30_48940, partial [Streptomyces sp. IBSBF 2953]|nr:hypothetical protein [Streptomyces hayashii]